MVNELFERGIIDPEQVHHFDHAPEGDPCRRCGVRAYLHEKADGAEYYKLVADLFAMPIGEIYTMFLYTGTGIEVGTDA